jgi:hypothetical protein
LGDSVDILPLQNVKGETLEKVVAYCEYHLKFPVAPSTSYVTDDIVPWVKHIYDDHHT